MAASRRAVSGMGGVAWGSFVILTFHVLHQILEGRILRTLANRQGCGRKIFEGMFPLS
jgi:hypothetical protein